MATRYHNANLTASGYMEFGRQGAYAYEALHKLADQYAARHYAGSVDGEFITMKCIDLGALSPVATSDLFSSRISGVAAATA
jgi:hypothetical protein